MLVAVPSPSVTCAVEPFNVTALPFIKAVLITLPPLVKLTFPALVSASVPPLLVSIPGALLFKLPPLVSVTAPPLVRIPSIVQLVQLGGVNPLICKLLVVLKSKVALLSRSLAERVSTALFSVKVTFPPLLSTNCGTVIVALLS